MQVKHNKKYISLNFSRRNMLKTLAFSTIIFGSPILSIKKYIKNCKLSYNKTIPFKGVHQSGILTPQQKNSSFIALNVTTTKLDDLKNLFKVLTQRISYLTQVQKTQFNHNDKMPPIDSGILGSYLKPDSLTITVSIGNSLFDSRFGLKKIKPNFLIDMDSFPNDQLESKWCGGDLLLQICANSQESVIYALRDILRHTYAYIFPLWKIEGFLPSRDIDQHLTPINLFGFKDGSGNAPTDDTKLMNNMIWVTEMDTEQPWCNGGSYQAVRIIRFNLEFWDRIPLEDQENYFGRHKETGAPIGKNKEMDSPEFENDPHGDRILFNSHIRRAEPRNPDRYTSKLIRRSYSYSLGVDRNGLLDMGLIFVSYQKNLKTGFINTQKRLNGEPLERYVKPFGGGYYFALPGVKLAENFLGQSMFEAL
ncbi:MAG: iron uptake transporter deferrochelatase/peroxidase subunit [Arsenophonus sp.]